jgi:nuclear transport factor 2 (NTF2) superfamily protein
MKTEIYKFIIELPDGEEIISDEYEYEWKDDDANDYDNYRYNEMLDQMEMDKMAFVFNNLSIRHCKIK